MNPVWIIDDDRSIRWVLEKALGREDIPAKSFGSADDALAALDARTAPQVLVSDIRMPGQSAWNCCATSRSAIRNCRSSS
jgi:two-component system nitrogen regulation response regulator GlnG